MQTCRTPLAQAQLLIVVARRSLRQRRRDLARGSRRSTLHLWAQPESRTAHGDSGAALSIAQHGAWTSRHVTLPAPATSCRPAATILDQLCMRRLAGAAQHVRTTLLSNGCLSKGTPSTRTSARTTLQLRTRARRRARHARERLRNRFAARTNAWRTNKRPGVGWSHMGPHGRFANPSTPRHVYSGDEAPQAASSRGPSGSARMRHRAGFSAAAAAGSMAAAPQLAHPVGGICQLRWRATEHVCMQASLASAGHAQ